MKMHVSDKKMEYVGKRVSQDYGEGDYPERIPGQRRQFADELCNLDSRWRIKPFAMAGIIAAAASILIVLGSLHLFSTEEIPFSVGANNATGAEGAWVNATPGNETSIRFVGGSEFDLRTGGARVIESNSERVIVDLEKGELHCSVNGNGKTRWNVRAGTYTVVVTGTKFTVEWTPSTSHLEVQVVEGSVLVSGAALSSHGVSLAMGDYLDVNMGEVAISRKKDESLAPDTDESALLYSEEPAKHMDNRSLGEQSEKIKSAQKAQKANRKKVVSPTSQWKALYDQKDFAGAVSAAKTEGLGELAHTLPADELWLLSKAARYARDGAATEKLLIAIRTRFPGTPKFQNATFLLGRVSEELLKEPVAAKQWYERYLSLGLTGALSEESLGRLIHVCQISGRHQKAKEYAKSYLSKYPNGSFAERAHSVLE